MFQEVHKVSIFTQVFSYNKLYWNIKLLTS